MKQFFGFFMFYIEAEHTKPLALLPPKSMGINSNAESSLLAEWKELLAYGNANAQFCNDRKKRSVARGRLQIHVL